MCLTTFWLLADPAPDAVEPVEVLFAANFVDPFVSAASADLGVDGTHVWRQCVFSAC